MDTCRPPFSRMTLHPRHPSSSESPAPIEIVPHDDAWPAKFQAERSLLQATLAPWLAGRIKHIGRTAVAGLAAKPVIDVMAAVNSLEASRPAIAAFIRRVLLQVG